MSILGQIQSPKCWISQVEATPGLRDKCDSGRGCRRTFIDWVRFNDCVGRSCGAGSSHESWVLVGMAAVICLTILMDETLYAQMCSPPPAKPHYQDRPADRIVCLPYWEQIKPSQKGWGRCYDAWEQQTGWIQRRLRSRTANAAESQSGAVKGAAGGAAGGGYWRNCWRCGRGRCHWCDSWRCKGPSTAKESAKAVRATGAADRPDSTIAATRWVSPIDGCLPRSQGIYG